MDVDIKFECDCTHVVEPLKLDDALKLPGVQEEEIRILEQLWPAAIVVTHGYTKK